MDKFEEMVERAWHAWNDADVRDSAGYLPHPRELARAALTAAGVPELARKAAELDALKARVEARIGDLKIESAALPVTSHRGAAIDYCVRQIESLLPAQEGDDGA